MESNEVFEFVGTYLKNKDHENQQSYESKQSLYQHHIPGPYPLNF